MLKVQIKKSSIHPNVTLNSSLLPMTKRPRIVTANYFRHSLHLLSPHRNYHYLNPIPQHSQNPCWHQMGLAKETPSVIIYHYYLKLPYPILFHACRSHLVP